MTFDGLIKDSIGAWNKRETEINALLTAAAAVIEAAKRHGSVGYSDRQIVYLEEVVERIEEVEG